jgi:fibronectin type III domain protein
MRKLIIFLVFSILLTGVVFAQDYAELKSEISKYVKNNTHPSYDQFFPSRTQVAKVDVADSSVKIFFSKQIIDYPLRPETMNRLSEMFQPIVYKYIQGASIEFYMGERNLWDFVPSVFKISKDLSNKAPVPEINPWVKKTSNAAPHPQNGLFGRHLVLWGSHGWFYDNNTDLRWEWQRPRMFTIVEDLFPTSFMVPFILPMVQNAGGVVCYPRERDPQKNEILVDDADSEINPANGIFKLIPQNAWKEGEGFGFKNGLAPYNENLNPHEKGHHHITEIKNAKASWIPNIPEGGSYAVYVSYNMDDNRADNAKYSVKHLGGITEFEVNQTMGGNTWLYLGHFLFASGLNPEAGSVELVNPSTKKGATVSADCVKFGGGMGDIIRGGKTSGYPRFCEAGRYWLQYAGIKPELCYKFGYKGGADGSDYVEDYVSRAEYANYLKGAPCGPNGNRDFPGLHVPVDLAFGFHTDAGIKNGIVGTLLIYKELDDENMPNFPDGTPRLDANRSLADLLQTNIVDDIRAKYCSTWTRRQLKDSGYSESRRGNMPSALLELLSHQNFDDMKYGNDPRFRFDVSRSIYKAFLKFIAYKEGYKAVVQPLPPTHFSIKAISGNSAELKWKPQSDPLEETAEADSYVVYMRIGPDERSSGFDNGTLVKEARFIAENLDPEKIYSFKITSCNRGGKSFPSTTLCVKTGGEKNGKKVLIVDAFDRIAPPSTIIKEGYSGFDRLDKGVGYMANFGLTGNQWDYSPASKFRTNDAPGHGASNGNLETDLELGNTFDFSIRHGAAIAAAGFAFDSASDEAIRDEMIKMDAYSAVDWLLGEERTTPPPGGFKTSGHADKMKTEFKTLTPQDQGLISAYVNNGGSLFLTGAYVATDLVDDPAATDVDRNFVKSFLKIYWTTNHGSAVNDVIPALEGPFKDLPEFHLSTGIGEDGVYGVELPDAIKPAVKPKKAENFKTSETVLRYKDNRWSCAVAMKDPRKLVVFGFPFESICGNKERNEVMNTVLDYLLK